MIQLDEIAVARRAAEEAGAILREKLDHVQHIEFKGERDLVTEADRLSQERIISIISEAFPGDRILCEESADKSIIENPGCIEGRLWIIDPLDGTTNFAHGLRLFAISIALMQDGELVMGLVSDPNSREMVIARKGKGTYLGETRIRTSKTESLYKSLLATGFPYHITKSKDNNINHFINFTFKTQAVRRLGSAALALTYVALGRLDGYWEIGLSPWDIAAGILLVREAGGTVSDFSGGVSDPFKRQIVASNGLIHSAMLDTLRAG
ncbi:MAG TPA: inositol monophosphatase [Firmicutes bacterium]|nr:inositol monophosphatase [Bacillota bacterium]